MKLAYPELLSHDLEVGIGELGPHYEIIPPEHRLRLPVSGIASLAITATLREVGYDATTIQTRPAHDAVQDETHVFSLVQLDDKQPTIVDATYSSLLRLTGLTPEAIVMGQKDMYPEEKILSFEQGNVDAPATALIMSALKALEGRELDDLYLQQPHPFRALSSWTIYRIFSEFWNPMHFREYEPDQATIDAARYIKEDLRHISVLLDESQDD